jgi:hypothetical protein
MGLPLPELSASAARRRCDRAVLGALFPVRASSAAALSSDQLQIFSAVRLIHIAFYACAKCARTQK